MSSSVLIVAKNFDGSTRKSWECRLLETFGDLLVFEGTFEHEVEHPELGVIRRGTVSREYYWLDRWYNVFRFFEPSGPLRNIYCNVNIPPTFRDGRLEYVDLDLDLLVWPDHTISVLDRDEFRSNAEKFNYGDEVIANAEKALAELIGFAEARNFPV